MRHALILAGGSGTRLWPYSTATVPKQLVPLFSGRSLLDLALERARLTADDGAVWIGAGPSLRDALDAWGGVAPERLVIEPSGRDTLPAVALGCAVIAAHDPEAVVAVLTADHLIEPAERFAETVAAGYALAEDAADLLVTFGVRPDQAATGYGYLELGELIGGRARAVTRFREKPPRDVAERYLEAGPDRYLWNSGMFVWRASTLLAAVDAFAPEAGSALRALGHAYGSPDFEPLAAALWPGIARQSVDYGVMEPASVSESFRVAALPLDARWLDVGSWPSYADAVGRDASGNAVAAARSIMVDSAGCLVASSDPDHLVTVVGCEDLLVVHTPEATLVCPVEHAQQVKDLHARVLATHPELA